MKKIVYGYYFEGNLVGTPSYKKYHINIGMDVYKDLSKNKLYFGNKHIPVIVDDNDEVWFSAKETAKALGYKVTKGALRNAISKNVYKKDTRQLQVINADNKEGHPHTLYINEPGLYRLMLRSKLKKAEEFADWVTRDVLPSIRKIGSYRLIEEHKKELHDVLDQVQFLERENKKLKQDQCKTKYPDGGVVYVIDYSNEREEIYRIGMTGNMKARKQIYDTHMLHNNPVVHIVKTDCPQQLESCVFSMLVNHKYYSNKKDFYQCKLSTIKGAFTSCIKGIKKADTKKQKGGSKSSKKNLNIIEQKLIRLHREKTRLNVRIVKLKKKLKTETK